VSSPPIACNIEAILPADRPRYRSLRDRLFRLVEHVDEISDGYALQLRNDRDALPMLAEWIAFERLCCPFLRFVVTVDEQNRLGLALSGGAGVKEFLRLELAGDLHAPDRLLKPGG
jgi:hypothetical protein